MCRKYFLNNLKYIVLKMIKQIKYVKYLTLRQTKWQGLLCYLQKSF